MRNVNNADEFFQKLKFELLTQAGCYPALFRFITRYRGKRKHFLVKPNTDLVIEGFPRSGNTFARVAFSLSQPPGTKIASHLHAPAQIMYAIRYGVPALILIRKPDDAVLSFIIRDSYISSAQGLRAYIHFYTKILPYLDKCVAASFEDVTMDFGKVIQRINEKYDTAFMPFEHNEQNVERCFDIIESWDKKTRKRTDVTETTVARPSKKRDGIKERLRNTLNQESHLLGKAFAIYNEVQAYMRNTNDNVEAIIK